MKLDKEAARRGVEEKVAKPLGVKFLQAVWESTISSMRRWLQQPRPILPKKVEIPRLSPLLPSGEQDQSMPMACVKMGAPRLLVPPNAGVGSALGFFTAPRAFDLLRSHKVSLGAANFNEIEKIFRNWKRRRLKF